MTKENRQNTKPDTDQESPKQPVLRSQAIEDHYLQELEDKERMLHAERNREGDEMAGIAERVEVKSVLRQRKGDK